MRLEWSKNGSVYFFNNEKFDFTAWKKARPNRLVVYADALRAFSFSFLLLLRNAMINADLTKRFPPQVTLTSISNSMSVFFLTFSMASALFSNFVPHFRFSLFLYWYIDHVKFLLYILGGLQYLTWSRKIKRQIMILALIVFGLSCLFLEKIGSSRKIL